MRRLGLERIDLFQLHRIDEAYPVADQIGELEQLQDEGKIRHIGLSEVDVAQLKEAQKTAEIVSVQNLYNLANRDAEELLEHCTRENIGFIPWFPLATGELSKEDGPLAAAAKQHDATPSQLALAWLLKRSPVMLPHPRHVERRSPRVQHCRRSHRPEGQRVRRARRSRLSSRLAAD